MNGQKLQVVDKFTYLGSSLSRAVHMDDEVTARTAKASLPLSRLRTTVWERNGIRLDTKLTQGCCTTNPLICMLDLDNIPTSNLANSEPEKRYREALECSDSGSSSSREIYWSNLSTVHLSRKSRESYWIRRLNTLRPHGINRND